MNESQKLENIENQIDILEDQRNQLKEVIFKKASKNWLTLLNAKFESSSTKTAQYLTFCKVFKKQFSKLLKDNFEIEKIPNQKSHAHFEYSGFFQLKNGKIFYFSIGDLRWSKTFLIREAASFTDFTGGKNQFCETNQGIERFIQDLKGVLSS